MATREPFKLRTITAAHNLLLMVWSALMFFYGTLDYSERLLSRGVQEAFCTTQTNTELSGRLFYITYWYYLSKYYELFDTIILVLKKKPLIFLHWYHHSIIILMVWLWIEDHLVFSHQGMLFNTLVHVFMYYYYFRTSLGQSVWFKRYITTLQIVQFVSALTLMGIYAWIKWTSECDVGRETTFWFSLVVNASFLVLFVQFYKSSYGKVKKA